MASADDRLNIHAQLEHLQVRTRGRSRQLDQTAAAIGSTFFFFQIAALSFSTCLLRSFARPECRRGIEQSEAYCSSVKKSKAREDMPQTRRTRDEFEPEQEKKHIKLNLLSLPFFLSPPQPPQLNSTSPSTSARATPTPPASSGPSTCTATLRRPSLGMRT